MHRYRHFHRRHYYGAYRRGTSNPIGAAIACTVFIGFFIFMMWGTMGHGTLGYFAPIIGIVVFIAISFIIAAVVASVRRKNQLQAQPAGTIAPPQGYPQQGGYPPAGQPGPQQSTSSSVTFESGPQHAPAGIAQPPTRVPANQTRFCTFCGTTVEGKDQRFCSNCGAEL
ncbi:MAG: zinc-ribbon domain-containing protein [Candidatus Lokiarchaeota archaeon]|nr:zinc-ribbon domain-containing protein [Candidatus Lokiarchaeota archaeon]